MKTKFLALAAFATLAFIACEKQGDDPKPADPVLVSEIKFAQPAYNIYIEDTLSLAGRVTVLPENATDKSLSWSTSDATVASIDASGVVKGLKEGIATITATARDSSKVFAQVRINVAKFVAVDSVGIKDVYFVISVDEEYSLAGQTTILPKDASVKTLEWSSSDPTIATVDTAGVVKGIRAGKAEITAKTTDGSGIEAKRTVNIRTYGPKYDLTDCEQFRLEGGYFQTQADYYLDKEDFLTGTACHRTDDAGKSNSGDVVILHQRTTPSDGVNAKKVTLDNGVAVLHIYIDDPSIMEYVSGSFQISSAGACDSKQLGWSWKQMGEYANGNSGVALTTFKQGWNVVELPFSVATKTGGNIDLTNINFYRIFNTASTVLYGKTFKVDRIYITYQK